MAGVTERSLHLGSPAESQAEVMSGRWQGIGMGELVLHGSPWQTSGWEMVGEPALWERTQDLQTENSKTSSIQGLRQKNRKKWPN